MRARLQGPRGGGVILQAPANHGTEQAPPSVQFRRSFSSMWLRPKPRGAGTASTVRRRLATSSERTSVPNRHVDMSTVAPLAGRLEYPFVESSRHALCRGWHVARLAPGPAPLPPSYRGDGPPHAFGHRPACASHVGSARGRPLHMATPATLTRALPPADASRCSGATINGLRRVGR